MRLHYYYVKPYFAKLQCKSLIVLSGTGFFTRPGTFRPDQMKDGDLIQATWTSTQGSSRLRPHVMSRLCPVPRKVLQGEGISFSCRTSLMEKAILQLCFTDILRILLTQIG